MEMPAGFGIHTKSVYETIELGEKIGTAVVPGTIIALTGDLGSGKTAFARGLARGMGVPETCPVTSPSYTLVNQYDGALMTLYHIDLYRLSCPEDTVDIGMEEILSMDQVAAIEWADRFSVKPWDEDIEIAFEITGENSRRIMLRPYTERGYALLNRIGMEKE